MLPVQHLISFWYRTFENATNLQIQFQTEIIKFWHGIRYQIPPKLPAVPALLSVVFWAFPALDGWGILFIFWTFQAAGRAPSTSFLFIITNYQFVIFHITIQFAQQSPQKLPSFQFLSILSNLHLISHPSTPSHSLPPPYTGVHFPLTKIFQKYTTIPSPTYTCNSLTFPLKMSKNGLKSLFFNR